MCNVSDVIIASAVQLRTSQPCPATPRRYRPPSLPARCTSRPRRHCSGASIITLITTLHDPIRRPAADEAAQEEMRRQLAANDVAITQLNATVQRQQAWHLFIVQRHDQHPCSGRATCSEPSSGPDCITEGGASAPTVAHCTTGCMHCHRLSRPRSRHRGACTDTWHAITCNHTDSGLGTKSGGTTRCASSHSTSSVHRPLVRHWASRRRSGT